MKTMGNRCASLLQELCTAFRSRMRAGNDHHERGDVPGWVMITLMSAVLVAALLALAGPALESMFNQAMNTVGS
ncbi:hypothetical protein FJ661_17080 [Pseudarthrobacter phenanthrenivorans]|uniref:hypothetical protein n=1 Tax=Pseudarthrobacter phenanthrenivorans TaxID=361575 RepID=UPI00112C6669|nr:hypothetical protein [Pseudarthrobacter phenanthrenivorans]TPV49167.1 hypothetical protein FJ661_17080 [Pseudarthrobacter phenanthrenivorans]